MRLPSRLATRLQLCSPCSVTRLGAQARQAGAATSRLPLGAAGPGQTRPRAAAHIHPAPPNTRLTSRPSSSSVQPPFCLTRRPAAGLARPAAPRYSSSSSSTAVQLRCGAVEPARRVRHSHKRAGRGAGRRAKWCARQHCTGTRARQSRRNCRRPPAGPRCGPPSPRTSWPCVPWSLTQGTQAGRCSWRRGRVCGRHHISRRSSDTSVHGRRTVHIHVCLPAACSLPSQAPPPGVRRRGRRGRAALLLLSKSGHVSAGRPVRPA